jgi:hypothetical protein
MGQTLNKTFGASSQLVSDHPLAPYTHFTDLYDTIVWDEKAVRKLIIGGVLAPIVKGTESSSELSNSEECPICFLYNNQVKNERYLVEPQLPPFFSSVLHPPPVYGNKQDCLLYITYNNKNKNTKNI